MIKLMTHYWWALALRGLAAVLFGIAAIIWPDITLRALVLVFGAYTLVDGAFATGHAFTAGNGLRWFLALEGLAGIALGILTMVWPGITALALAYWIAAWAVITGILAIAAAIQLRKLIENEWLLGLGGVASVAFGAILMIAPGEGALALLWLIGGYAILFGALLIGLGFRLRTLDQRLEAGAGGGAAAAMRA